MAHHVHTLRNRRAFILALAVPAVNLTARPVSARITQLDRTAHSSSGPGHLPLKEEIEGSNPSCATKLLLASIQSAYPSFPSDHNLSSPTIGQRHPLEGPPSLLLHGIGSGTFARLTCPTTISRLRLESWGMVPVYWLMSLCSGAAITAPAVCPVHARQRTDRDTTRLANCLQQATVMNCLDVRH
jgi:hypothetical protein